MWPGMRVSLAVLTSDFVLLERDGEEMILCFSLLLINAHPSPWAGEGGREI